MRNSDSALLERWINVRDPEAFAQLVDRHAGMVLATCRRVLGNLADAEEAAQECFLQVSQARRTITPSLGGWLHRVATRRALDRLRSDTARSAREQNYAVQQPATLEPSWNDVQPHVDTIIAELPDELQVPLVLHFFEGCTHAEVARMLGVSRSTVTERIQRAISEIREQLAARNISLSVGVLAGLFGAYGVVAVPTLMAASLKKIGLAAGRPAAKPRFPGKVRVAIASGAVMLVVVALWVANMQAGAWNGAVAARPTSPAPSISAGITSEAPAAPPTSVPPAENGEGLSTAAITQSSVVEPQDEEEKLRLRCVDEAGEPVVGAEVYYLRARRASAPLMQDNHPDDTKQEPFGPVMTDSGGYVEVPGFGETPDYLEEYYRAYARVPNKLVGVWNHSPKARKDTGWDTIAMVKSMTINGSVAVPATFDPAKVTVNVLTLGIKTGDLAFGESFSASTKDRQPMWPELFSTTPGRDGHFSLGDIPIGHRYYLSFTAPGLGEAQRYSLNATAGEPIDIEMHPEATISGTVRHSTGAPAVDMPIFAIPYGGRKSSIGVVTPFRARTDALGRYTFKGLPGESYSILVQHYGNPPSEITPVIFKLEVQFGSKNECVDLTVERGALQDGYLLDRATERPIPDTWLIAMNPGDGEGFTRSAVIGASKTDQSGKFSFRLPTGESYLYFVMAPEDYHYPEGQGKTHITVGPGVTNLPLLTFHLAKKSEAEMAPIGKTIIEGRVVSSDGQPLADVPVELKHRFKVGEDNRQRSFSSRPTNEEGRFSVEVQATGEYQVNFGDGDMLKRVESERFTVVADETKSLGDIEVEVYEQIVVVTLANFNDDATADPPQVSVRELATNEHLKQGPVDAEGRIEFNVPDKPLLISAKQKGYKLVRIEVEPGSEVEIALEPEEPEAGE